ncbi:MAG: flagellar hook-length control protein FliK [Ruminococcus sp.]|jgi:hypothetical protein|nr:flagellar hook-length control protein FliK [Ruminococcus sp.]
MKISDNVVLNSGVLNGRMSANYAEFGGKGNGGVELGNIESFMQILGNMFGGQTENKDLLSSLLGGQTENANLLKGLLGGQTENTDLLSSLLGGQTGNANLLQGLLGGQTENADLLSSLLGELSIGRSSDLDLSFLMKLFPEIQMYLKTYGSESKFTELTDIDGLYKEVYGEVPEKITEENLDKINTENTNLETNLNNLLLNYFGEVPQVILQDNQKSQSMPEAEADDMTNTVKVDNINSNTKPEVTNPQVKFADTLQETPQIKPTEILQETPQVKPIETLQETPQVKSTETLQETPQIKPTETLQETPQIKPIETLQETPQVKPIENLQQATPQVKPTETLQETPQIKPTETLQQETPQVKPIENLQQETPQVKPTETLQANPQIKPTETLQETPQVKPTETLQATPQVKPTETLQQETPQVKPTETLQTKPEVKAAETKPLETTPEIKPMTKAEIIKTVILGASSKPDINANSENQNESFSQNQNSKNGFSQNQTNYFNNISEIKKEIKADSKSGSETQNFSEVIDTDSLQKQVVHLNSSMLKLSQPEMPKPIYQQVYSEVSKNLSPNNLLGKEEFNIKLNPESLGEIAVKIVKDAGKMLVTLTASSETTAKILNAQLNQLQNQLKAYNAEVAQVVVQNQTVAKPETANNQAYQQQYDESAQQFDKESSSHQGEKGGHNQNRRFFEYQNGEDEDFVLPADFIPDFAEQFSRAV